MISSLLEYRESYGILFTISYTFYYFANLQSLSLSAFPVFPNVILFMFIFVVGLIMAVSMQEIDHQDVPNNLFSKLMVFAMIPTIMAQDGLKQIIKKEERKQNDDLFILGLKIIRWILIIISSLLILVIFLVLFVNQDWKIAFIPFLGVSGVLGYALGYEFTRIKQEPSSSINWLQSNILAKVAGTRSRRIGSSVSIMICLFVFYTLQFLIDYPLVYI